MSAASSLPVPDAGAAPHGGATLASVVGAVGLALAAALPPLLAYNQSPAATLYNQLLALAGWGLALILCTGIAPHWRAGLKSPAAIALALLLVAPMVSVVWRALPLPLGLDATAVLGAGLAVLLLAQALDGTARRRAAHGLFWGLLIAGVASVGISLVQVFRPEWANGDVIARSGIAGRAVSNLRQPNHLASLMMWAAVAAVFLTQSCKHIAARVALPVLLFGFVFTVVLSASRTGFIGIGMLALWGVLDRGLSRSARIALLVTPLMLGVSWWLMAIWSAEGAHAFGAASRLSEGAGSPSRVAILRDAWALTSANPLVGVGWGEFNVAWSLTPFPTRPIAFFDHTHNLPSQLAVELGLPWAGAVLVLLGWAVYQSWRGAFGRGADLPLLRAVALLLLSYGGYRLLGTSTAVGVAAAIVWLGWGAWEIWRRPSEPDVEGALRRAALMVVLAILLHSMLEYPLWYAYFLLPACFAFGLATPPRPGAAPAGSAVASWGPWAVLGGLLLAGSVLAKFDYARIVAIYAPSETDAPLNERIATGQRSPFFGPQADYAAATSLPPGRAALEATRRTAFNLVDARLLMHWSRSLEATGDLEGARFVADRLREFRNPIGDTWFATCTEPASAPLAQCTPASGVVDWRQLR